MTYQFEYGLVAARRMSRKASSSGSVASPIAERVSTASAANSSHFPAAVWPTPFASALKRSLSSNFRGLTKTFLGALPSGRDSFPPFESNFVQYATYFWQSAVFLGRSRARPFVCRTCLYARNMSKMIQVRDVSEQLHSTLKARAAREGMSLSDFIKKELERAAERPTMREWLEQTRQAKPIRGKRTAAEIVRELREAR